MTASRHSAMEIPPFHKAETLDYVVLRDDFITGGVATTLVGELGWTVTDQGDGVPVITHGAGEVNHPGVVNITTGNTTPNTDDGAWISTVDTDGFILTSSSVGIYLAAVVRFPTDLTNKTFRFGLSDAPLVAIPANGVWIEMDNSTNAALFAYGSTKATVGGITAGSAPDATAAAATWYKLEIAADDTEIQYYVDGVLIGRETTAANIPVVGLSPFFQILTDTTNEESVDIDAFMLRALVTR